MKALFDLAGNILYCIAFSAVRERIIKTLIPVSLHRVSSFFILPYLSHNYLPNFNWVYSGFTILTSDFLKANLEGHCTLQDEKFYSVIGIIRDFLIRENLKSTINYFFYFAMNPRKEIDKYFALERTNNQFLKYLKNNNLEDKAHAFIKVCNEYLADNKKERRQAISDIASFFTDPNCKNKFFKYSQRKNLLLEDGYIAFIIDRQYFISYKENDTVYIDSDKMDDFLWYVKYRGTNFAKYARDNKLTIQDPEKILKKYIAFGFWEDLKDLKNFITNRKFEFCTMLATRLVEYNCSYIGERVFGKDCPKAYKVMIHNAAGFATGYILKLHNRVSQTLEDLSSLHISLFSR